MKTRNRSKDAAPPGKKWIYVRSIRHKSGKRLYASNYGLKAFRILVDA